jgi:SAM-dependent methyltransferase
MTVDYRTDVAQFYDSSPNQPDDVPFYLERLGERDGAVLELGCGTGRVTIPLAQQGASVYGIDNSEAMLAICRQKLAAANLPSGRVMVGVADITDFALDRRFDLILAPFRVMQLLETDEQVDGLFRCIDRHLAPDGRCILNVFNPNLDRDAMQRGEWISDEEHFAWEVPTHGGRIDCHDRRRRMNRDPLVVYPELVYRRYLGDKLEEEVIFPLVMRCYYPDEFPNLITSHGFRIVNTWGGYAGQPYGDGPELVVEFTKDPG